MCIYQHHPIIEGMLQELPEIGDAPPEDWLARWLRTLEINLRLIYNMPESAESAEQAAREYAKAALTSWTDVERQALRDQALATAREVTAEMPFLLTGSGTDDLARWRAEHEPAADDIETADELEHQAETDTLDHAAERAAELEAERYDLEQLEREQAGRPRPAAIPPEIAAPKPFLEYDRAGRYIRKVLCPFPSLVAGETCGKQCQGEMGLLGHLSGGHGLRGHARHIETQRRAYVDEAIAIARGEIAETPAADVEAIRTKATEANADLEQIERDRRAGRPLPEPEPLNRQALSDLIMERPKHTAIARIEDGATNVVAVDPPLGPLESLRCPYGPENRPCGAAVADAIVLDLHLRAVHDLDDDRARLRVGLVDQALDELDERIATAAGDADGTLDDNRPAATRSTEP